MTFTGTIHEVRWTCVTGAWLPRLLGVAATTLWATCYVRSGICPNGQSLAHEFSHTLTTNPWRYVWSATIGRLWGDGYWKNEERAANQYGLAHANDPEFLSFSATIRAALPASWPTVTIDHPV